MENIADSSVAILLLLTIDVLPAGCFLVLEILHALASNGKIVKQLLLQGNLYFFAIILMQLVAVDSLIKIFISNRRNTLHNHELGVM